MFPFAAAYDIHKVRLPKPAIPAKIIYWVTRNIIVFAFNFGIKGSCEDCTMTILHYDVLTQLISVLISVSCLL